MIEIFGVTEGEEYAAAVHLREQMVWLWPDLAQDEGDQVKIFVGHKMYGHKIEDLDLVVLANFKEPRKFAVECEFYPRNGARFIPKHAEIKSFALVVEVKSHDASAVRFNDTVASVRYRRRNGSVWEPVTEKNRRQMFEFKSYLEERGASGIYIQNLIFFKGMKERDLPQRPHNCFAVDASFERILNVLGQVSAPLRKGRRARLVCGTEESLNAVLSSNFPLFSTLEPTALDRRRMDRIAQGAVSESWIAEVGEKQVTVRGRGGVGKTVVLLQLAYRAFDRDQMRSLVLAYNHALVADVRRLMALLGVPRSIENGGVGIQTVHSFMGQLMRAWALTDEKPDRFIENYEMHKATLREYLQTGALAHVDVEAMIAERPLDFCWDAIFVDEGQDWPKDEIDILRMIYGAERMVVADGVDQYVRDSVADWSVGLDAKRRRSHRMTKCLRMKANLTAFVMHVARGLGLEEWDLEPNPEAAGGRILVVDGDMSAKADVYQRVRSEAAALGNYPIDLLACVPPSLVEHAEWGSEAVPARAIRNEGDDVWDGAAVDVRKVYPTDRDALRVVQYDSSRGLEGWAVINYALDELWRYKYRQYLANAAEDFGAQGSAADTASAFASRWIMIPLTRAMDTLVINLTTREGPVRDVVSGAAGAYPDFVEWRSV